MINGMLSAEFLKMKKICLWIPVISAVILLLFTCMEWYLYFRQGEAGVYTGLNVVYLFLSFTMLLTISLLCSVFFETEHQAQGMKMIFSMPVSRRAFYFIKALWVIILMLICCSLILLGASLIWIVYTNERLPFLFLTKQVFGCFAASLPVLGIQLFLSARFANQTFPLAAGAIGAISSLFLARFGTKLLYVLPWAYPSMASPFIKGYTNWIILGVTLGLIILLLGSIRFGAMEMK